MQHERNGPYTGPPAPHPGPSNGYDAGRKDRDHYRTRINLFQRHDDIWLFLDALVSFFSRQRPKTPAGDKYMILMDRLSNDALGVYTDNTPPEANPTQCFLIASRRLCYIFGPADPTSYFTNILSTMKQGTVPADIHLSNLWKKWRAYLLHLHTLDPESDLPEDIQFVNYFLAGLNRREKLQITDHHITHRFTGYIQLHRYMFDRRDIWALHLSEHVAASTQAQTPQAHLNHMDSSQHPDRAPFTGANTTRLGQPQHTPPTETLAATLKSTLEAFTDKITTSLNTVAQQMKEQHSPRPPHAQDSYLNNHFGSHMPQQGYHNNPPHSHDRYNSPPSRHGNDYPYRQLNFHNSSNSDRGRSRSPHAHHSDRDRSRDRHHQPRSRSTSPMGGSNNCFSCGDPRHMQIDCSEITNEERDVQAIRIITKLNLSPEDEAEYRKEHKLTDLPQNRATRAKANKPTATNKGQNGYCHWCHSCGHFTIFCTSYCVLCKLDGHNWTECKQADLQGDISRRKRQLQPLIEFRKKGMSRN